MPCTNEIKPSSVSKRVASFGHLMQKHQSLVKGIQWAIVFIYVLLVVVPAFLPLPDYTQHIWDNLTLLAQFLFWGIWWPFVLLSMVLMGRIWCGVFCPEGTVTEYASKFGLKKAIPRWIRWGGWPFIAFVCTTIYGQMISVYQYPKATLLVLGGSTIGAIVVGFLYGKEKRVWCRYLCPVNGVFRLMAKLAPFHYFTDRRIWSEKRMRKDLIPLVNCPTLLPLSKLDRASDCHMCGRCSGHNDAIMLKVRAPGTEITVSSSKGTATFGEFILITFGMGGVAIGAFHWSSSPWFVLIKQYLAGWLITHNQLWVLQTSMPWWFFTNYPDQNDVFNLLDGILLLVYMILTGMFLGIVQTVCYGIANRLLGSWSSQRFFHLSYSLIPIVSCGVFLGLSSLTITLLKSEHISLNWVNSFRAIFLFSAMTWSIYLLNKLVKSYSESIVRKLSGLLFCSVGVMTVTYSWYLLFWGWN